MVGMCQTMWIVIKKDKEEITKEAYTDNEGWSV